MNDIETDTIPDTGHAGISFTPEMQARQSFAAANARCSTPTSTPQLICRPRPGRRSSRLFGYATNDVDELRTYLVIPNDVTPISEPQSKVASSQATPPAR